MPPVNFRPTIHDTVSANIVARRRARGWRQMDLAAKAQVSRDWVSKAENGRNISIQVLYQLSAALGLSPEDLLQRSAKRC